MTVRQEKQRCFWTLLFLRHVCLSIIDASAYPFASDVSLEGATLQALCWWLWFGRGCAGPYAGIKQVPRQCSGVIGVMVVTPWYLARPHSCVLTCHTLFCSCSYNRCWSSLERLFAHACRKWSSGCRAATWC